MRRRTLVVGLTGIAGLAVGARCGFNRLARAPDPEGPLSDGAVRVLQKAMAGLEPSKILDDHVHIVGLGAGGTGCYVNDRMGQWARHPVESFKFSIYRTAAGVLDEKKGDQQYVERLKGLLSDSPAHGRALLLAFDQTYREDGTVDKAGTEFYAPNEYVLKLAKEHPECFVPAASVHPYRKDALEELQRCIDAGVQAVKWLPNAQGIDPMSERCDSFYELLAKSGVPLLTHAGEEQAVDAEEAQKLGNPLRFRRPLDHGVKVIIAHCASLGMGEDLDKPDKPHVSNFDLFLRLMSEEKYKGLLYADISAITQFNRCEKVKTLLERQDLHDRLIYGSDYPLPAINALVRTGPLESLGLIDHHEREALNELDRHNPLLFDLVAKRTVALRKDGKLLKFADSVFQLRPGLFPALS
ncbi:MAG: amidohydrolase family protein [Myxococcaceae bacterium]